MRHYGACVVMVAASVCGCSDDDEPTTNGAGGSSAAMAGAGGSAGLSGSGGERPSFGGTGGLGDYIIPPSGGSGGASGSGAGGNAGSGSVDAGDEPSGSSDAGTVQSCLSLPNSCLEFRGHRPACQESNAPNCMNLLAGEYIEAPCPSDFVFIEVEETFCGPSATFVSLEACCANPNLASFCPSCPAE